MPKRSSVSTLALLALLLAAPARSATSPTTAPVPHGKVALVAEMPSIHPHGELWLALHFTLEPGWHIYWINPGDSGEPARLIWHLPAGLSAGAIAWPAPQRLVAAPGVVDFGYTGDAVFLVPVRAAGTLAPGTVADLSAELRLVVCREICIPGKAQLSLSVPVRASVPGESHASPEVAGLFASARAGLPQPAPASWKVSVQQSKDEIILNVTTGKRVTQAAYFPLQEDEIDNAAPQTVEPAPQGFRMRLRKSSQLLHPLDRLQGVVELDGAAYTLHSSFPAPVKNAVRQS